MFRRRREAAPFDFVPPDLPVGGVRALVGGVTMNLPTTTFFGGLVADITEAVHAVLLLGAASKLELGAVLDVRCPRAGLPWKKRRDPS